MRYFKINMENLNTNEMTLFTFNKIKRNSCKELPLHDIMNLEKEFTHGLLIEGELLYFNIKELYEILK